MSGVRRLREIRPGFLAATASLYLTTSTVVAGAGGGCLVIDPAVTVAEVAALAADLAAAGLRPEAGFATHPHWDHLLWHRDLGDVTRYAAPRAARAARERREALLGEMEAEAPGHDRALFGRLVPLPAGSGSVPWNGPAARVIVHDGHAPGHAAVFFPSPGILVAGDMCSDTEIPLLDLEQPDPVGRYRAGLARLAAVAGEVRWLIPGHGHLTGAAGFRRRLSADARYLDLLERGRPFEDPRCSEGWLRRQHARQLRAARP